MGAIYDILGKSTDADWLALRKTGIGASEMSVLLGVNPWKSEIELWGEKTGRVEAPDLSDVESVRWGQLLEPVVLEEYRRRADRAVRASGELLRSCAHPWALATLDGETCGREDAGWWPLEAKTTSAFRADDWEDGPPEMYRVQVHHQMLVTGAPRATIVCLLGGQRMVWQDIERDEQLVRKIVARGSEFWARVQSGEPPSPDGSASAKRALAGLYPEDDGATVELPDELDPVVEELLELKARGKDIEARITAAENRIKAAIGDAQRGVLPSGMAVSWKLQHRDEHVVKASSFRVLRTHKPKARAA